MPLIEVDNVTKDFRVHRRPEGWAGALRSLVRRHYDIVRAVNDVSFRIEPGELVGYIGPNGAGKSTTVKMLAGILIPTAGRLTVDGRVPHAQRIEHARRIGVVFGQRSQLYWDLPLRDTFDVYKKMYRVDDARYRNNLGFLSELLGLGEFLRTPVRQLSLGQKTRANLAVALLHDPHILFLDEPTIGLDVVSKTAVRDFIHDVNRQRGLTVLLTSHDLYDIERLCPRILMIDHGRLLYDGSLAGFKVAYGAEHTLVVDFAEADVQIADPRLREVSRDGVRRVLAFDKDRIGVGEAIALLARHYPVTDLAVQEPDIEDVVRRAYAASGKAAPGLPS